MSKNVKVVIVVGVVLAALGGSCLVCLAAGLLGTETGAEFASRGPGPTGTPSASIDGRYVCQSLNVMVGGIPGNVGFQIAPLPPFTISGDAYETADGSGSLSALDGVATFTSGPYDGWRGAIGTDGTGPFILFDGKVHDRVRTGGAKHGDLKCYRQKG